MWLCTRRVNSETRRKTSRWKAMEASRMERAWRTSQKWTPSISNLEMFCSELPSVFEKVTDKIIICTCNDILTDRVFPLRSTEIKVSFFVVKIILGPTFFLAFLLLLGYVKRVKQSFSIRKKRFVKAYKVWDMRICGSKYQLCTISISRHKYYQEVIN